LERKNEESAFLNGFGQGGKNYSHIIVMFLSEV